MSDDAKKEAGTDAAERYRVACKRRDAVYAAWEKLKCPLTTKGSRGQQVEHPLIKQMNNLDMLCDKLDPNKAAGKRPGPDALGQIRAEMTASVTKLRAVK